MGLELNFETIGINLKQSREMSGVSIQKAIAHAEISRSYLFRVEKGERRITVLKFYKLCEIYKVDAEKLIAMTEREFKQYLRSLNNIC